MKPLLRISLALLPLLLAAALSSCHSSRRTVSGNDAIAVDRRQQLKGSPECTRRLLDEAFTWLGTPYHLGWQQRGRGTDCSGFLMEVYRNALGILLPRNSLKQSQFCIRVDRSELMPGDLVFFDIHGRGISHVGMYVGDGRMIHASGSSGVIFARIDDAYFGPRYAVSGRPPRYAEMLAQQTHKASKKSERNSKKAEPQPEKREISLDNFVKVNDAAARERADREVALQREALMQQLDSAITCRIDSVYTSWMD